MYKRQIILYTLHLYVKFLAIFRNEITTILTPSTSEGGEGGHVFCSDGRREKVHSARKQIFEKHVFKVSQRITTMRTPLLGRKLLI